ncbi:hypothetical protein Esti_005935 [Eimeria stiedai]
MCTTYPHTDTLRSPAAAAAAAAAVVGLNPSEDGRPREESQGREAFFEEHQRGLRVCLSREPRRGGDLVNCAIACRASRFDTGVSSAEGLLLQLSSTLGDAAAGRAAVAAGGAAAATSAVGLSSSRGSDSRGLTYLDEGGEGHVGGETPGGRVLIELLLLLLRLGLLLPGSWPGASCGGSSAGGGVAGPEAWPAASLSAAIAFLVINLYSSTTQPQSKKRTPPPKCMFPAERENPRMGEKGSPFEDGELYRQQRNRRRTPLPEKLLCLSSLAPGE